MRSECCLPALQARLTLLHARGRIDGLPHLSVRRRSTPGFWSPKQVSAKCRPQPACRRWSRLTVPGVGYADVATKESDGPESRTDDHPLDPARGRSPQGAIARRRSSAAHTNGHSHLVRSSGASIALLVDGKPSTVVITDHVALEVDLAQYNIEEGPCITALAGNAIRVGCLSDDERFPHFAVGAADQRVVSVLSTPIVYEDATIGTLNIYSRETDAFDDADQTTANLICAQAANAIAKSELLSEAKTIRAQLQAE